MPEEQQDQARSRRPPPRLEGPSTTLLPLIGGDPSGKGDEVDDPRPRAGRPNRARLDGQPRTQHGGQLPPGARPDRALGTAARRLGVGDKAGVGAKGAVRDIAKGAVKGASGESTEGKAFGGGLTGAAAGMVREAVHHASWKWVALVVFTAFLPAILLIGGVVTIGSILGGLSANAGESSAQAVVSSTGVPQADLALYQEAVAANETPWQVVAAVAYYESGKGEPVGQTVGICPPATGTSSAVLTAAGSAICPAIGQGITSGSQGTGTGLTTQTVPLHVVPKDSPDRVTTNTADWACIRAAASGDDYSAPGGAYGISQTTWSSFGEGGTPAAASQSAQNRFALKLFAQNGYQFGRVWHDSCTAPALSAAQLARYDAFGLIPGKHYPQSSELVPTTDLGAATWLADLVTTGLERSGGWTSSSQEALADGVTVPSGSVPRIQLTDHPALQARSSLLAALAALPIRGNSHQLDVNIYELAVDWSVGYTPSIVTPAETGCAVASGSTLIIPTSQGEEILDAEQISNAGTIVSVGRQLGVPTLGLDVAIDTALAESSLENLPNVNVPGSETDPNVQWGPYSPRNPPSNGTSVGLFQQQDLWGTVVQRMNQPWSAAAFYGTFTGWTLPTPEPSGLAGTAGWQSMGIAQAAQAVQGSADPSRYLNFVTGAQAIVDHFSNTPCAAGVLTSTAGATQQGAIAIRAAERFIGAPYVWGGGDPQGPTMGLYGAGAQDQPPNLEGKPGFDCSGLVQYAYAQAGILLPRTSEAQASFVQSLGGWTTNLTQLVPGDLVFFAGSDGTIASPGHVGIYLGNDQMIQAPETGQDVDIVTISASSAYGFAGGGPVSGLGLNTAMPSAG